MACIITIIPILWVFLTSLKYFKDIVSGSWSFTPTFINYYRLFTERGFDQLFFNSVVIGVFVTLICLMVGGLAAYNLSRFRWASWFRGGLLGWILFTHMIPPVGISGSLYLIMQNFGLYNTRFALILAHTIIGMPFAIWMIMAVLEELPKEMEEMAMIDGCTRLGSLFKIVLPLSAPTLAATAVLTFVFSWNEFLFALTLTSTPDVTTIPVGIANFVQEYNIRYGEMAAAAFLATVPMIIFVALVQKYLVAGLTMGALKE